MNFILKGDICYSETPQKLKAVKNGYLVCENGVSRGVFEKIPEKYNSFPVSEYENQLIIPGLTDLHIHASQYAFRGLGLDMELLGWLETHTFPEESRFAELDYADKAYDAFVEDLRIGATTRACIYATLHTDATVLLMEKLEKSGLVTLVGKVNMDRNSPEILRESSAQAAFEDTKFWIEATKDAFVNTKPIITPRFLPTCSEELLRGLGELQREYKLPVQSHISENKGEIAWVKELFPNAGSYGEAYDSFGLFGGEGTPTVMAHCVWSEGAEEALLKKNGVYIAHCPQSNANLSSGIAPIRRFLQKGMYIGLGSDVGAGCHTSIFRAMSDAIHVSKLYSVLAESGDAPLSESEAFYMGTLGGGSFFGKVGSFDDGYEFDALVIDDSSLPVLSTASSVEARISRMIYLFENSMINAKYVRGKRLYQII